MWDKFAAWLGFQHLTPSGEVRTIHAGDGFPKDPIILKHYPDNTITSSKYTVFNFIPKNLFEQFRRIANFYFLIVFLIQLLVDTPTSPVTSGLPLLFVISVTAIKQGYEDWLRHLADRKVNNALVLTVKNGHLVQTCSSNIKVGDIVYVRSDEIFPCDLILLSSSGGVDQLHDEQSGPSSEFDWCYITTASLDGESDYKTRFVPAHAPRVANAVDLSGFSANIECQPPDADLYRFEGTITFDHPLVDGQPVTRSLGPENLLVRGARLKDTPFIYGIAVHTGMDTKMSLNYRSKSQKRSVVERSMNTYLLVYLCLLVVEALLGVILKYSGRVDPWHGEPWYNPHTPQEIESGLTVRVIVDFLDFIILFNFVIPVSLYVTVEMQKFLGAQFVSWDMQMNYGNEGAVANTSDLNEELGQVEYVLTDKTGTLTENIMTFRQLSFLGQAYKEADGKLDPLTRSPVSHDPLAIADWTQPSTLPTAMALCHTVRLSPTSRPHRCLQTSVTAHRPIHDPTPQSEYLATSADERALVEGASRFGVVFLGLQGGEMVVNIHGVKTRFELLDVLEFDNLRRRMSIIIRTTSGTVYLLTKGADSAILPLVVSGPLERTKEHIHNFALEGLRVLCFAARTLSDEEFAEAQSMLTKARTALSERQVKVREAYATLETQLDLLGATAVEDKLQVGVKESLRKLREAGMRIWTLTGDKQETAVTVGYASGQFTAGTKLIDVESAFNEGFPHLEHNLRQALTQIMSNPHREHALVVSGARLGVLINLHSELFSQLSTRVDTVLCCRMAPLQKAEVVRFVKDLPSKPVTLAIGDGANDVGMIQEAHVGVGIVGSEGRQAARNSDFALPRFSCLPRLLLVHGHLYYQRISHLVQYFFYKNVAFMTPQFLFQFYCGFSHQTLYDSAYLMIYNLCFTSLPILAYGLLEQYQTMSTLQNFPILYRKISKNALLAWRPFIGWTLHGLYHAFIFFFGSLLLLGDSIASRYYGQVFGHWMLGVLVCTNLVFTVNLKLALDTRYWTWVNHFVIWGTLTFYVVFSLFYGGFHWLFLHDQAMHGVFLSLLSSMQVWLLVPLILIACLVPDVVHQVIAKQFCPGKTQMPASRYSQMEGFCAGGLHCPRALSFLFRLPH
uniref:phospholipid-transporting ATPase IF-like isoform X2 n=1 Tax=Myxine glutinosa TaxID=7769 RepID=UPI00358E0955